MTLQSFERLPLKQQGELKKWDNVQNSDRIFDSNLGFKPHCLGLFNKKNIVHDGTMNRAQLHKIG